MIEIEKIKKEVLVDAEKIERKKLTIHKIEFLTMDFLYNFTPGSKDSIDFLI